MTDPNPPAVRTASHLIPSIKWLAYGLSASLIVIALLGAIRSYSPVPFWDMWDGYIGFFFRVEDRVPSTWWGQHNEHRIFLARLFFWLDLKLFHGMGASLIVANQILAAASGILFAFAARDRLREAGASNWAPFVAALFMGMAFFWSQENNLTWGFQSQFFLAQLVPAAAFYFLARSHSSAGDRRGYFLLATVLGVLASGSMANGVLALPVMIVYAIASQMHPRRIFFLCALAGITVIKFYSGYVSDAGHAPLSQTLLHEPVTVARFLLMYLGSPAYFVALRIHGAGVAALLAGAVLVFVTTWRFIVTWPHRSTRTLDLAMLAFLLYIGGTAAVTALGRVSGGIEQSLSSRYTTPALMAWMAATVLVLPWFAITPRRRASIAVLAVAALIALIPYQRSALTSQAGMRFDRMLGATALALGIRDEAAIGQIYPFTDRALNLAARAVAENVSIFGEPPLEHIRLRIGTLVTPPAAACVGTVDTSSPVFRDAATQRISGWIGLRISHSPELWDILDITSHVVGFAVSGRPMRGQPGRTGFTGYVLTPAASDKITLVSRENGCRMNAILPLAVYMQAEQPRPGGLLVPINQVVDSSGFQGSDIDHSHFVGTIVMGSIVASDSDRGAIRLVMRRGEYLYYRSGPTAGRQTLAIPGLFSVQPLPLSVQWSRLVLDDPRLPDRFEVIIRDNGDAWGEWSAVALGADTVAR
jgi:hypothetical protein